MTAFNKSLIIFFLVVIGWFFSHRYKPDMTVVYPDNCSFTIDRNFSEKTQLQIKHFIDEAYKKSKNPSNLLPSIEHQFSSIRSVVIDMQNPEQLCFTIQSQQPIFILNESSVVCQQGLIFDKDIFSSHRIAKLHNVEYEGKIDQKNIVRLIRFYESLPHSILQDFSIRWVGKYDIWLDQKQGQDLSLLVGYELPLTADDIAQCRKLRGQIVDTPCKDKRGKPCKKNTTWVCDLRFDRQIVLFSTNKGG